MKRGTKRRLAGIVLVFAMLIGLYPNMPLLAENEELQSDYDIAVESYWEKESDFWTAVDNYYGNEENGTEGALPKYYEALDNSGNNVDFLYNLAMDTRIAVVTAYETLTAAYSAVNTEYDKLAEEEKSSVEESYNDITSCYAVDKQCHDELEIPESPAVRAYYDAENEYWEAESEYWKAMDAYYGDEKTGITGALQEYYAALESDKDEDTVKSLYAKTLSARETIETAYVFLTEKYDSAVERYAALSENEKGNVEGYTDVENGYNSSKECFTELEIPDTPAQNFYWNAESDFWNEMESYLKKVDDYCGNEETGQKGALQKYDEVREEGKDVTAVLKLYEAALDARSAVISSYENLTKKYEIVQGKYQALSVAEKEKIENYDEIGNACTDAKNVYDTLEIPEPLAVSQEPVVQTSGNIPKITLHADTAEILEKINLTEAEKKAVCDGDSTDIILNVAGAEPTPNEKKLIQEKLGDYTIGQYMNIELLLKVGDASRKITDMTQPVRISITIPDSLVNKDTTKKRTYSIIRIHNGAATVTDGTYDASSGTLTFATDRFSIYTLVYKDEKVSNPSDATNTTPITNPSDTTNTTPVTNPSDTTNTTSTANTVPATNTTTQTAGTQAVKTGDHTPITEMGLLLFAAAVAAGVMGKRMVRYRKQR